MMMMIMKNNKEHKHAGRNKQKVEDKDDWPHMDAHLEVTNKRPGGHMVILHKRGYHQSDGA